MVAEQKRVSNIVSEAFFAEMSRRGSEQEFRDTIEELEEMAREMEQEEAGGDRGGSEAAETAHQPWTSHGHCIPTTSPPHPCSLGTSTR